MDRFEEAFRATLNQGGIILSEGQIKKFQAYYELLIDVNSRVNLTAITEPQEVAQKHFADSILPVGLGLIPEGAACADVGSGAGFPGLPILIIRPDIELTLIESSSKRADFLKQVGTSLGLTAQIVCTRAEDAARTILREHFDIALARAVAPLNVLVELLIPFVKVGGSVIAYKGPGAEEELQASKKALELLGARAAVMDIQTQWGIRKIIKVEKNLPTPEKYPRRNGIPAKNPL